MKTETLTTVKIPNETLIKIKGLAVEKGTTQTDIILQFINKGLNKTKNKATGLPKARVINKELPYYNPNKKGSLKNIIGAGKVDKDIDVDKALDNIHYKEELYK